MTAGMTLPSARAMPANVEAEQALLGALLINNAIFAQVVEVVRPEQFIEDLHRQIYQIMATLIGAGKIASPITIKPFLSAVDLGGGLTAQQYLVRLAAEAPTLRHVGDFARQIADLSARRDMIYAATALIEQSYDAPVAMTPAQIASGAIGVLHDLAKGIGRASTRHEAGDSAGRVIEHARAVRDGRERDAATSTGLLDLDRMTGGGCQPGDLWILAGRPGMGKSVLGGSLALKMAKKGDGVLLNSMEMGERQLTSRLLSEMVYSHRRPIPFQDIMRGRGLVDDEFWMLEDAKKRLDAMPLTLDFGTGLTVPEIAMRVRSEKQAMMKRGAVLRVLMIDYLDFVKDSGKYAGQKVHQVGEKTQALKNLARDEQVCVILLTQLNRQSQSRDVKNKRPTLGDLRDSGNIEQDADVVLMIHREAYYTLNSEDYINNIPEAMALFEQQKNNADLIIAKNRSGPCRDVPLWCDLASSVMNAAEGNRP